MLNFVYAACLIFDGLIETISAFVLDMVKRAKELEETFVRALSRLQKIDSSLI